jgi:UDP-glucose 4-epimerase
MTKILVTGASGFIGQALVRTLAADGYTVRAASRKATSSDDPAIEQVRLPDLAGPVDWPELIDRMDAIVHLAGIAHAGGPLADDLYDRVNHRATADLAAAAARAGIDRLVFVSSIRAQTGPSSHAILTEDREPTPSDAYGRSKLAAEAAVRASGAAYTILRPVIVHGPSMKGNLASLARLAALPVPLPFGGFAASRSVLSLDSFVDAVRFVLGTPATAGQTYIVADQPPLTLTDMLALMREVHARRPNLFSVPKAPFERLLRTAGRGEIWDRIAGPLVADPAKLRAAGWRPRGDSREMFKRSLATPATVSGALPARRSA